MYAETGCFLGLGRSSRSPIRDNPQPEELLLRGVLQIRTEKPIEPRPPHSSTRVGFSDVVAQSFLDDKGLVMGGKHHGNPIYMNDPQVRDEVGVKVAFVLR